MHSQTASPEQRATMNRQCMRSWGLIFLTTVILNLLLTWILTFSGVHGIPNPTHARWPGAVPPLWPHPGESGAVAVAYEQRGLGTHVRDIEVAPDHHRNVIHRAVRIDYGLPLRCMSVEFQRVIDRRVTPPAVVDVELPLRSGIRLHAAGKPWPDPPVRAAAQTHLVWHAVQRPCSLSGRWTHHARCPPSDSLGSTA